jgi:hypothetical protein
MLGDTIALSLDAILSKYNIVIFLFIVTGILRQWSVGSSSVDRLIGFLCCA